MTTSSYLEQTLSYYQSPAAEQYFELRAAQLFELQGGNSSIEIHVQQPKSDQSIDSWTAVQKSDLKQEFDSDLEPPSPVDWDRYSRENPPRYVGWPGLQRQSISNPEDLKKMASVRKLLMVTGVQTDVFFNKRRQINAFVCGMYTLGHHEITFQATHCSFS